MTSYSAPQSNVDNFMANLSLLNGSLTRTVWSCSWYFQPAILHTCTHTLAGSTYRFSINLIFSPTCQHCWSNYCLFSPRCVCAAHCLGPGMYCAGTSPVELNRVRGVSAQGEECSRVCVRSCFCLHSGSGSKAEELFPHVIMKFILIFSDTLLK